MDKEEAYKAHIMVLPFHGQGHINAMIQFSKRLATKGIKITVATILSNVKSIQPSSGAITFESIYDDCAEGGLAAPGGFKAFFERFEASGSRNFIQLCKGFQDSEHPVKFLIYDANISWASKVANVLGIARGAFFVQNCAFIASLYPVHCDVSGVPPSVPLLPIPGLPEFRVPNLPSMGPEKGGYQPILRLMSNQFDNIGKSDWVFFNTFDVLDEEVINWMSQLWPVITIGPALPSIYLDNRVEGDNDYGFNIYNPNTDACMKWLDSKEKGSVVYVSFGSAAELHKEQTPELAKALVNSGKSFLWVVKPSEEHTLPTNFSEENSNQGLVVKWCPQLAVLAHDAVGCFISHCGWNSGLEALCLGVPVVAMPQFLDHMTTAHCVEHIWKAGIQPKANDDGLIPSEEISRCIGEIMTGERGKDIKKNVARWKALAKEAVDEGGSSDKHIDEIIAKVLLL